MKAYIKPDVYIVSKEELESYLDADIDDIAREISDMIYYGDLGV